MTDWINAIVQGVLLGGYYSLIATGLAFMFQVMRIINLAHGTLAVMAGFALWVLADRFGDQPLHRADRGRARHGGFSAGCCSAPCWNAAPARASLSRFWRHSGWPSCWKT